MEQILSFILWIFFSKFPTPLFFFFFLTSFFVVFTCESLVLILWFSSRFIVILFQSQGNFLNYLFYSLTKTKIFCHILISFVNSALLEFHGCNVFYHLTNGDNYIYIYMFFFPCINPVFSNFLSYYLRLCPFSAWRLFSEVWWPYVLCLRTRHLKAVF